MTTDAIRQQLIADAPEWARFWAQNASGSGYYWEHRPVRRGNAVYWAASPECYYDHKCRTQRHDLNLRGVEWSESLVEIPARQPALLGV